MSDSAPRGRNGPAGIDVGVIMRDTLAWPHSDLVTRPTGRAVREAIENHVARLPPAVSVSLIDLNRIRVLDFSCADEVVAGLLLRYLHPHRPRDAFFLFRAVEEVHRHAVEEVLARHALAAACTFGDGAFELLGAASGEERAAWSVLERRERLTPGASASLLGPTGHAALTRLCERRLAYRNAAGGLASLSALARSLPPHAPTGTDPLPGEPNER